MVCAFTAWESIWPDIAQCSKSAQSVKERTVGCCIVTLLKQLKHLKTQHKNPKRGYKRKKVNAVKPVVYQCRQAEDCIASVPLISLTAVKKEARTERTKPLYALLDAGADTSLCTRELAEDLFGWNPEESISIKFLEKDSEDYPCMKQPLVLQHGNGGNVALQDIPFVDTKLPYHQCIPSPSILLKYGLSEETFPVVSGDRRREDMIFGVNVMRKLQILQNCEWKDSEPSKSLIGFRPIGSIFWG